MKKQSALRRKELPGCADPSLPPSLRGLLTATSNMLRWMFGWETTFEEAGSPRM